MMFRRSRFAPLVLLIAICPAWADDIENLAVHGRLEFMDIASLGAADHNDLYGNFRATFNPSWGPWTLDLHYLATLQDGKSIEVARDAAALVSATPTPPNWLGLTETFANHGQVLGQQTIDRLSIGYSAPDFVLRVGRQALSWGAGMVFRPMDLFDPFSPTSTDTEFKPGTDMFYSQFLFQDGSDLQFIAVPRPEAPGGAPASNDSSVALHYRGRIAGLETTLLLARDYGDWTGGLGVGGSLAGARWNVEIVPTIERQGSSPVSLLANIDDAVTLFDRNATVFSEYFHNGFGVLGRTSVESLPPDLKSRLARGQLFDLRQNYLATGLTLEWSPLVTISPTAIAGLDDGSFYLLAAMTWSLKDDLVLILGGQMPIGAHGTEFGGLFLGPGNMLAASQPSQLYLQLRQYF